MIFKIGQGKGEDFKEILNFTLTILCELELVSEKMENKSFFFKWNSFKGFFNKFIELLKEQKDYEISESLEHRAQLYTRYLILFLIRHQEIGITSKEIEDIMLHCGLEGQYKDLEKIHFILCFIGFIQKEENQSNTNQIFALIKDTAPPSQVCFKINPYIYQSELHTDLDKSSLEFNQNILSKGIVLNEKVDINDLGYSAIQTGKAINNSNNSTKDNQYITEVNDAAKIDLSQSDFYKYQVDIESFNKEKEEEGFALLKGANWIYYIKKLYCIIGRSPLKNFLTQPQGQQTSMVSNTTWEIDVDLGQNKKISKQHALIAYNFHTGSFEIKNLSKKFSIKVNGEFLKYNEEMILTSKSVIHISNQEFYFLLSN